MKFNRKITLILALALVCTVATGILIYTYMSPKRETVYVFNDTYTSGTPISASMLSPVQADATIVVAGQKYKTSTRFVSQAEIEAILQKGDTLRVDVARGMPLMASMLSVTGGNSIEMAMSTSGIAITVPVNDITGVTNDLSAGAHVNVYASGASGSTYLLFENMRILAVAKSTSGSLTSATLELTNEEALKLVTVSKTSSIYLGLVNGSGYQYAEPAILNNNSSTSKPNTESSKPAVTVTPNSEAAPVQENSSAPAGNE